MMEKHFSKIKSLVESFYFIFVSDSLRASWFSNRKKKNIRMKNKEKFGPSDEYEKSQKENPSIRRRCNRKE